ncbi:Peptidoglycan-binding lysin domain protein [Niveomyces insectorum RCEF 264]|uniref:Peptidoglycan-binding lysin domain protein n=1 Tax=Niveomyces insectorum RCEF 264 TaxID=1081102 RepID=A0A167T7I0_9HYPO|nr:Peptidoglycan-binding lysin domain protein [Niveomyces insectorum RCEF 264]
MYLEAFIAMTYLPLLLEARFLASRQAVSCEFDVTASSTDTCDLLVQDWNLSLQDFEQINPGVQCPNLVGGQQYCVMGSVLSSAPGSTTGGSTKPTPTTPMSTLSSAPPPTDNHLPTRTSSASPYEPTQPGLVPNCDNFHLVVSGDTCFAMEQTYGISAGEFSSWNPSIDSDCSNLWMGYYACVHAPRV